MEVFLSNLPADLSQEGLNIQLEPYMKALNIENYLCEKPKRVRYGNVTFMRASDGRRFLQQHGETAMPQGKSGQRQSRNRLPRTTPHLFILSQGVYCRPSNRQTGKPDGQPSSVTIRVLEHAAEERQADKQDAKPSEPGISLKLRSFSCGYCAFGDDNHLMYHPEASWASCRIVRFTSLCAIIELESHLIRIPLNTIVELVWSRDGSLTFILSTVPLFFSRPGSIDDLLSRFYSLGLDPSGRNEDARSRLCSLGKQHAAVVGQCLVYQCKVVPDGLAPKMASLARRETVSVVAHPLSTSSMPLPHLGDLTTQTAALESYLARCTQTNALPFGILFQLQALVYNAYLPPATVLTLAKQMQHRYDIHKKGGQRISEEALKKLFAMIDWPKPNGEPSDFSPGPILSLLQDIQNGLDEEWALGDTLLSTPTNLARIRRIVVTPSRITLHGPELEAQNRILRKFPNHHDFFIRVQFCDENGQDLMYSPKVLYDKVYARFKEVLKLGVEVAGRTYSFLGFSHSSLRAHSVWFCAPFFNDYGELETYFSIISGLGTFSHIRSPARCAARIGQAFSETPFAVPLDDNEVLVTRIPDITSADGLRVFSDGIGSISPDTMGLFWSSIPENKSAPSCFQIRCGGVKGMVAVDTRLDGRQLCIRESMEKFETRDMKVLGICDMASKPIPLVLNRQVIKILEDMGVGDDWFFRVQEEELSRLRRVTKTTYETAKFLKTQGIGEAIRLYKFFRQLDALDLDYRKDDFLRSVVEAAVLKELRLLKHKGRIPVRQGMTLFGVLDETGYLKEGEVFISFDTQSARHEDPPPDGCQVLVTRSPALHPGDVQKAINVVPPDDHPLSAHCNSIVFSQHGDRDLPSMLSGGDLDGDLYNVIWDQEAVTGAARVLAPADYPRVSPVDIGREVGKDDMADFFVDFMKTDQLGVIATRHVILADQKDEGTLDRDCLKLAELHSNAVDFSKTGVAVDFKSLPRSSRFRPDFLARGYQTVIHNRSDIELEQYVIGTNEDQEDDGAAPRFEYYRSEKILGKLYRAVDEQKIWYEEVRSKVVRGGPSFWDEFLKFALFRCSAYDDINWERRSEEAWRIRLAYEDAIATAMSDFSDQPTSPISELEVFIGAILNKSGVQTRRQRDRSIKLRDEVERITSWIVRQMRHRERRGVASGGRFTDSLELCLACIFVGGQRDPPYRGRRRREDYDELRSFTVVAAAVFLQELHVA